MLEAKSNLTLLQTARAFPLVAFEKVFHYFKKMGAFSLGVFVGTVYGSVIATLTAWTMLSV